MLYTLFMMTLVTGCFANSLINLDRVFMQDIDIQTNVF